MTDQPLNNNISESISDSDLDKEQLLKYGQDLARIYVAEKAKRENLEIAYQTLNAIFASTPEGLVVLDSALKIQQANMAFEQLVEADGKSILGRPIAEVLITKELGEIFQSFSNAGSATQVELTMTHPIRRFLLASIAPLGVGTLRGWVITLSDQSRRKQIDYQKSEFINIAAHELRTPLTAILGYAEILASDLRDKLDSNHQEYFDDLLNGAGRLSSIVNELIHFASLNTGQVQPRGRSTCLLADFVTELVADLSSSAAAQRVELIIKDNDPKRQISVDLALLRSVLYQLILNAINFNKPGGDVCIDSDNDEDFLYIHVIDSGIGIAQTDLENIFQPFFQAEDHNIRAIGGLGLGLSIAQRAAAELGGTLFVRSLLGQGSVFTLQLPLM